MSRSEESEVLGARLAMRSDGGDGSHTDVLSPVDDPAGYDRAIPARVIRHVLPVPRSAARRVTSQPMPPVRTPTLDLDDDTHLACAEVAGRDHSSRRDQMQAEPQAHGPSM
jgi:hypothetical protein